MRIIRLQSSWVNPPPVGFWSPRVNNSLNGEVRLIIKTVLVVVGTAKVGSDFKSSLVGLEGLLCNSQVLHHDVLVRDEAVHPVVPALPPVLGGPVVQQEGRPLLEGQLAWTAAHVVKLGDGLALLQLCEEEHIA